MKGQGCSSPLKDPSRMELRIRSDWEAYAYNLTMLAIRGDHLPQDSILRPDSESKECHGRSRGVSTDELPVPLLDFPLNLLSTIDVDIWCSRSNTDWLSPCARYEKWGSKSRHYGRTIMLTLSWQAPDLSLDTP